MSHVRDRVLAVVAAQFSRAPQREISRDTTFFGGLGGDELDRMEIVMTLEHEFERYATDDEIERFVTVGDLASWLESKVAPKVIGSAA